MSGAFTGTSFQFPDELPASASGSGFSSTQFGGILSDISEAFKNIYGTVKGGTTQPGGSPAPLPSKTQTQTPAISRYLLWGGLAVLVIAIILLLVKKAKK